MIFLLGLVLGLVVGAVFGCVIAAIVAGGHESPRGIDIDLTGMRRGG